MDLRSDQGEIGSVDSLGEVFAGPLVTAKAVGVRVQPMVTTPMFHAD